MEEIDGDDDEEEEDHIDQLESWDLGNRNPSSSQGQGQGQGQRQGQRQRQGQGPRLSVSQGVHSIGTALSVDGSEITAPSMEMPSLRSRSGSAPREDAAAIRPRRTSPHGTILAAETASRAHERSHSGGMPRDKGGGGDRAHSSSHRSQPSEFAQEVVLGLGLPRGDRQTEVAMSVIDRVSQITDEQLSQLDADTRQQIIAIRKDLKIDRSKSPGLLYILISVPVVFCLFC